MKKAVLITLTLSCFISTNGYSQAQNANEIDGKAMYIQGLEAFQFGNLEQAEEFLLGAFEKLGPQPGLNFALGDLYLSLNNYSKATLYLNQALKNDPTNKWYSLKLIEVFQKSGQLQQSIAELNKIIELHPQDTSLKWALVNTYSQIADYQASNNLLYDLLNKGVSPSEVHLSLFNNFDALNKKDSALVHLRKASILNPYDLTITELLKAYSEDTDGSNLGIKKDSKGVYTYSEAITIAQNLFSETKFDSAKSFLLAQYRLQGENKGTYSIRIAEFLNSLQDSYTSEPKIAEIAHEFYSEALSNHPSSEQLLALAGEFYAAIFQYKNAHELLDAAITLNSRNEAAWRLKLQLLSTQGEFESVIEQGMVANKALPDDAYIQFFVGSAFLFQDNSKDAIEWLERASRAPAQRPFKSLVFTTLGDVHASLGNNDLATRNFELALRYDPNNDEGKVRFAKFLIHQRTNLDKAEILLQEALNGSIRSSDVQTIIGELYFTQKDFDKSIETLLKVVESGEASAHTFEVLGNAYEQINNLTEAKKWWKQALIKDPSLVNIQQKIQSL